MQSAAQPPYCPRKKLSRSERKEEGNKWKKKRIDGTRKENGKRS
jgi:hypothetical protein